MGVTISPILGAVDEAISGATTYSGVLEYDAQWLLDLMRQNSIFACTSIREIWGYSGDPSAANTPVLISVPANVDAITGGRWNGSKFLTVDTSGNTLNPYTNELDNTGKLVRKFTAFSTYAAGAVTSGDRVAVLTSAGNRVYMTSQATDTAVSVTVTDADIGSTVADAGGFNWQVDGYATIKGQVIEDAATKRALWNRDLRDVAWAKTNVTVAKDTTGAKGDANSASTLTATAGNGTILQTVTIGAANYAFAPYVKRKTGTGTVEVTIDNGGTWTDITTDINSNYWVRVLSTKSAANPIFGFRIVTDTDEIEVDFCDMEAGTHGTSPQETGAGTVTRAASSFSDLIAGRCSGSSGAVKITVQAPTPQDQDDRLFTIRPTAADLIEIRMRTTLALFRKRVAGGAEVGPNGTYTYASDTPFNVWFYWDDVDGMGIKMWKVGDAEPAAFTTLANTTVPALSGSFKLGQRANDAYFNCEILSCEITDNKADFGW